MKRMGTCEQEDDLGNLGVSPDYCGFTEGDYPPAQFKETNKQQIQDAMDCRNGK